LVIDGGQGDNQDWHQLSRKHVIETNNDSAVISILGGKLTDCLNVGQEVLTELRHLGLSGKLPPKWFGEGSQQRYPELLQMLQSLVQDQGAAARISEGLWRRHGEQAFEIIQSGDVEEVFGGLGICYAELQWIAAHEDVVTREDLLRRRLPIAMARSAAEIANNQKLQALLVDVGL
jgi:glycerol-3-phosphate dehydrogenase